MKFFKNNYFEQLERERRSKNVFIFGVGKSSKMSFDEQRKYDDLALNEIMNYELDYELTKVAFFFALNRNQIKYMIHQS